MTAKILGVYKALYDYEPQETPDDSLGDEQELVMSEDELFFLLEKGDDGWFKVVRLNAKKPKIGLAPGNYLEKLTPVQRLAALCDYTSQNEDELSFQKNNVFQAFDNKDPNWVLVHGNDEYGFVPATCFKTFEKPLESTSKSLPLPPPIPKMETPMASSACGGSIESKNIQNDEHCKDTESATSAFNVYNEREPQYAIKDYSDYKKVYDDHKQIYDISNTRPQPSSHSSFISCQSQISEVPPIKPPRPMNDLNKSRKSVDIDKQKSTFLVEEVVGKRRKSKGKLQIDANMISYTTTDNLLCLSWQTTNLASYSCQKRHVFLDLENPQASFDFRVESVAYAESLMQRLSTVAGALKANGLRDIAHASGSPLSNLPADSAMGRFVRNKPYSQKSNNEASFNDSYNNFSRDSRENEDLSKQKRNAQRSQLAPAKKSSTKEKPNMTKIRTWTDHTGTYKVEAEFLGLKDGNLHFHKVNGVKISVPSAKMSTEDLNYIHNLLKKRKETKKEDETLQKISEPASRKLDWFDFFLNAGIDLNIINRYQRQFESENINEECIGDLNPAVMRAIGIKEGDIIKITKYLKKRLGDAYTGNDIIQKDQVNAEKFHDDAWKIWPSEESSAGNSNIEKKQSMIDMKALKLYQDKSDIKFPKFSGMIEAKKTGTPAAEMTLKDIQLNTKSTGGNYQLNSLPTGSPFTNLHAIPTGQTLFFPNTPQLVAAPIITETAIKPALTSPNLTTVKVAAAPSFQQPANIFSKLEQVQNFMYPAAQMPTFIDQSSLTVHSFQADHQPNSIFGSGGGFETLSNFQPQYVAVQPQPINYSQQNIGFEAALGSFEHQIEDVSKFRPVQFGIESKACQKANLHKATPDNPFGF